MLVGWGAPAQASQQYTSEEIQALVCGYDWPCAEALAVLWCESRGDPSALAAGNYGLFQITPSTRDGSEVIWTASTTQPSTYV